MYTLVSLFGVFPALLFRCCVLVVLVVVVIVDERFMLKVEDDVADGVVGNAVKQVADIIFYLLCSLCVLYEDDSSFVLEEKKDRARVCGVCACIIETEERSAKECVRASPLLI
jgi:hypothetical protein